MAVKKVKKGRIDEVPKHEKSNRIPLSNSFTIISILGLFISIIYTVSGRLTQLFSWAGENAGNTWGFLFILFFVMMLIASFASIDPGNEYK